MTGSAITRTQHSGSRRCNGVNLFLCSVAQPVERKGKERLALTFRLAVDIGGTFTDSVSIDGEGKIGLAKNPTNAEDLTAGVMENLKRLDLDLRNAELIAHGTVFILDSLLQRRVGKTGLITTEGFRDVLEIMRTNRPEELIFDIQQVKPTPFVPRRLRFEVPERLDFNGQILRALDEKRAEETIRALEREGVEAIAVCLLHSYANDIHEQKLKAMIEKLVRGIHVSLSSEVAPQWREFERTSTTVLNACTIPIMQEYVSGLQKKFTEHDFGKEVLIMQSNGGLTTAETARNNPVMTLLSSPAAGVIGASHVAKTLGLNNVITYDHGGSGCFISVVENGVPSIKREGSFERWPILTSMIDVDTVHAGGNSVVWIDPRDALRIGPRDVGTDPGPACFDKGGGEPTVTDASLLLGHINPDYFMAGEISLDANASREALKTKIGDHYKMEVDQVAHGILDLLVSIHAKGIREISIEKGYDPRDLTLMAFGGAGGLCVSMLARELGIPEVVVPFLSSHMSCLGLLIADMRHDYHQTFVKTLEDVQAEDINKLFRDLEDTVLTELETEGIAKENVGIIRSAEVRYIGQEFSVEVPIPGKTVANADLEKMNKQFSDLHEKYYGFSTPMAPAEIVSLKVTALGHLKTPLMQERRRAPAIDAKNLRGAFKGDRMVSCKKDRGMTKCPTYERRRLSPGNIVEGPAVVEEPYSTILLMPGDEMVVDEYMNATIRIRRTRG